MSTTFSQTIRALNSDQRCQRGKWLAIGLVGLCTWTLWTVQPTVTNVASESKSTQLRIEFAVSYTDTPFPVQHGLPGVAGVAVQIMTNLVQIDKTKINLFAASHLYFRGTGLDLTLNPRI